MLIFRTLTKRFLDKINEEIFGRTEFSYPMRFFNPDSKHSPVTGRDSRKRRHKTLHSRRSGYSVTWPYRR